MLRFSKPLLTAFFHELVLDNLKVSDVDRSFDSLSWVSRKGYIAYPETFEETIVYIAYPEIFEETIYSIYIAYPEIFEETIVYIAYPDFF